MDPFLAQIMMFGGNFAPRGWAFCDGQLLSINANQALFSLLGTTYGGDGRTTFGLPDLRGRVSMHAGHGPGLSNRNLGQKGGAEHVVLNNTQIPSHNHTGTGKIACNFNPGTPATTTNPVNGTFSLADSNIYNTSTPNQYMAENAVNVTTGHTGGNLSHTNIQPFTCVNYIIALQGVFPSRS